LTVRRSTTLLADPNAFEESLCGGTITVAMHPSEGEVVHVHAAGHLRDGARLLDEAIAQAGVRCEEQYSALRAR
jgi:exosome complex RNA-binding protein Rrp42 (RNase PH superfamily)